MEQWEIEYEECTDCGNDIIKGKGCIECEEDYNLQL